MTKAKRLLELNKAYIDQHWGFFGTMRGNYGLSDKDAGKAVEQVADFISQNTELEQDEAEKLLGMKFGRHLADQLSFGVGEEPTVDELVAAAQEYLGGSTGKRWLEKEIRAATSYLMGKEEGTKSASSLAVINQLKQRIHNLKNKPPTGIKSVDDKNDSKLKELEQLLKDAESKEENNGQNPLQQAGPLMPFCDGCDCTDAACKCPPECACDDHCKNRNKKDGHATVVDQDPAQEAIMALEALSSGGIVRQARTLKGYLLKFPVEQRAEEGKKWAESKDFSPEEKAHLARAYTHEVRAESKDYPTAVEIFGDEQVEGSSLSLKLSNALDGKDLGEVDINDPATIKVLHKFEDEIVSDVDGAVEVISGHMYGDVPYKWVDLYRALAKIYQWEI